MRIRWMLIPLLACGAAAAAQSPSARIGMFAGMNQAHIEGSQVFDISNHAGGAFGAYIVAPISNDWSFQTGAFWSMKGWERDEPGTRDLAVAKLTYLEVPLLLRYDIAAQERVGGFVFGGAGVGFRAKCSLSATTHSTGQTQSVTCADAERLSNGTLAFKSTDAGAMLGAGVRVGVGREQLVITSQYEYGLTEVERGNNAKSRVLSFGVGLELPIHRK